MWVRILLPLLKYQRLRFGNCLTDAVSASNLRGPLKTKMRKFINYLKESYVELAQKVTWPTWDKLQSSAFLVLIATVILAAGLFVVDYAFENLMKFIYTL